MIALYERVQEILRLQCVAYIGRSQRNAGDCPIAIARGHGFFRIYRLVCSMKRTDAEMNNACALCCTIVGWTAHAGG
jgi:hypothetical protein